MLTQPGGGELEMPGLKCKQVTGGDQTLGPFFLNRTSQTQAHSRRWELKAIFSFSSIYLTGIQALAESN